MNQSFETSLPEEMHLHLLDIFSQYPHAALNDKGLQVTPLDGGGLVLQFSKGNLGKLHVDILANPRGESIDYIHGRVDSDMKYAMIIAKEQRSKKS